MNKIYKILISIVFSIIFVSCFSNNTQVTRFYLIELPSDTVKTERPDKPLINMHCEIENVDISPAYATYKIANRSASNSITYYQFHQWAVLPEENITRFIYNFHTIKNTFKGISDRYWKIEPELKLKTRLDYLEIAEIDSRFYMHMKVDFTIVRNKSEEILLTHNVEIRKELNKKSINLFAEEISLALYDELNKLNRKLVSIK